MSSTGLVAERPLRSQASLSLNWALMAAGLVDRVQVTIFPVISGRTGTSPILGGAGDFDLELLESRTLDGHTQELVYRPTGPVTASSRRVLQMRLVVEADDYDEAVRFYRDVLGAAEEFQLHGDGGERVTILDVGRATLEISSPEQVDMIDRVEVGRRVSPKLRVAFEVADTEEVTGHLVREGAELIAPPTRTPWDSVNARLAAPGGLQITVFEEPAGG